jgi:hypothetical protein
VGCGGSRREDIDGWIAAQVTRPAAGAKKRARRAGDLSSFIEPTEHPILAALGAARYARSMTRSAKLAKVLGGG